MTTTKNKGTEKKVVVVESGAGNVRESANAKKLKLSKLIFKWVGRFVNTKEYEKASRRLGKDSVPLFHGWGHEKVKERYGHWGGLYMRPDGTLLYQVGYKWMPYEPLSITTPEGLARAMLYEYLQEVHLHLYSGEIHDTLNGWIKSQR